VFDSLLGVLISIKFFLDSSFMTSSTLLLASLALAILLDTFYSLINSLSFSLVILFASDLLVAYEFCFNNFNNILSLALGSLIILWIIS